MLHLPSLPPLLGLVRLSCYTAVIFYFIFILLFIYLHVDWRVVHVQVVARKMVPEHDVVVTNPPYSADHIGRALKFCQSNLAKHGRPWVMLLPNYVYAKVRTRGRKRYYK